MHSLPQSQKAKVTKSNEINFKFVTLHHEWGRVPPNINFEILQYSKLVFSPLLNGENGVKIA